ncbi:MAG: SpoIIE family protein phosphatase [Planctomycetota bacterium]|jgi:sigma-B regulation protein RsbU (phosphoserine phosphatase)
MKIRWKLLILLLLIALAPLAIGAVLQRSSMRRLGGEIGADQRATLESITQRALRRIVDEYGELVRRDARLMELCVQVQAYQATRQLAEREPDDVGRFYYTDDFDARRDLPADAIQSDAHLNKRRERMWVSYSQQAYLVVDGVAEADVRDDMARLAGMPDVYRILRAVAPEKMKWQYTSLESGFHTTYPAHGDYDADYDPRQRPWYLAARQAGDLNWSIIVDVTTRELTLTVAKPVYAPGGQFVGVTAIDVPLTGIVGGLTLPDEWGSRAEVMFVGKGQDDPDCPYVIFARAAYVGEVRDWRKPVEVDALTCDDPAGLAELIKTAEAGQSGVRELPWRGQRALWAHGAADDSGGPFALIIVPLETITAPAAAVEQDIWRQTLGVLQITGAVLGGIAVVVVLVTFKASRAVTRPIDRLARAAVDLAGGDFDARADVHTGDEFQDLSEVFNDLGPKLREREKLKHSLALAMQVQQHLLPDGAPQIDGFDIAGRSVYCDETGGDYYDFIELIELGPNRVGIALGDVSGHGIGAALLMASARAVLRSHAGAYGDDLGGLFDRLNRHLVRDTGDARFMTLFYGIVDGADRTIRWVSGGHDPAIWFRRQSEEFGELPATGVPLGVVEDMPFMPAGPITVESGDVVVIGTDGIWEARNEAEELFGKDRLRETIAAHADESASHIYAAILDAVAAYRGDAPQEDDVTLVVIKGL